MVKKDAKTLTRSNVIVGHALLEEITFVFNKFWKQTPSKVTERRNISIFSSIKL